MRTVATRSSRGDMTLRIKTCPPRPSSRFCGCEGAETGLEGRDGGLGPQRGGYGLPRGRCVRATYGYPESRRHAAPVKGAYRGPAGPRPRRPTGLPVLDGTLHRSRAPTAVLRTGAVGAALDSARFAVVPLAIGR